MERKRVVITGLGTVSPVGSNVETFWKSLTTGKSGIAPITRFDASNHSTKFAGEASDFDELDYLDRKNARRMDRFTHFSIAVASQAIEDAGVDLGAIDLNRFGVLCGCSVGGIETFQRFTEDHVRLGDPKKVNPFFVTMFIPDIASGRISIEFGLKGPNYSTSSACATSAHAISDALMLIQRGAADMMLAGGAEAPITDLGVAGFNAMRALSLRNDAPEKASRPFDTDRDGFVIAEGAGMLMLETLDHALERGAKIYAELLGFGNTADAHHITAPSPDGEGAARAMTMALQDAGVAPEDIDYLNAHGTSTPYNDPTETKAIKTAFGEHAKALAISSTKSMTGHLLGAAGAVEAVATTLAVKRGVIPPTVNLDNPDPECDLDYTPNVAVEKEIRAAISNAFGFGGHNASLVFKRYKE
ncbi:MAG: beta-ketoacyl-ACP synthase II [Ignavibacteriales bacterium]|nr:beta-ketoacyl-ACP synthase II [Ignavibacteriales bacterium]